MGRSSSTINLRPNINIALLVYEKELEEALLNQEKWKWDLNKAHFFHFERWDKSLITKYIIEASFIVIVVSLCYSQISSTLDWNNEAGKICDALDIPRAKLNSLTEGTSEYEAANKEYLAAYQECDDAAGRSLDSINISIIVRWNLA